MEPGHHPSQLGVYGCFIENAKLDELTKEMNGSMRPSGMLVGPTRLVGTEDPLLRGISMAAFLVEFFISTFN